MLFWGAVAATVLGALSAFQLDLIITVAQRLMQPESREALIRTTQTASLTGLLCWVAFAIFSTAIRRAALKPSNALADHCERLADGDHNSWVDLRAADPAALRLGRAISLFHQKALESCRAQASLQARYDGLQEQQADERREIIGMLLSIRRRPEGPGAGHRSALETTPAVRQVALRPTPQAGRYDSLYETANERRLLMDLVMNRRPDAGAAELRPSVGNLLAEFSFPERPQ